MNYMAYKNIVDDFKKMNRTVRYINNLKEVYNTKIKELEIQLDKLKQEKKYILSLHQNRIFYMRCPSCGRHNQYKISDINNSENYKWWECKKCGLAYNIPSITIDFIRILQNSNPMFSNTRSYSVVFVSDTESKYNLTENEMLFKIKSRNDLKEKINSTYAILCKFNIQLKTIEFI